VLQNPQQVLRALHERTEVQDVETEPQRRRLQVVEDLTADNERKRDRILGLYLDGRFEKESLMERKSRLDSTLAGLERERATLQGSISRLINSWWCTASSSSCRCRAASSSRTFSAARAV
jgi:hypothetical protein